MFIGVLCEGNLQLSVQERVRSLKVLCPALLDLIENGEVDGIVCWHPDRLYRRLTDLEAITDLLQKSQNLSIYPVKAAKYDLDDSTGVFISGMIAAEGLWHGGKVSTGYKRGDGKGKLVIDFAARKYCVRVS